MMRYDASLTSSEVAGATLLVVQGPEAVTSVEAAAAEDAYGINISKDPTGPNQIYAKCGLIKPKV